MMDIVLPKGNEEAFIDIALRLGYTSLCFAYENMPAKRYETDRIRLKFGQISSGKKKLKPDITIVKTTLNSRKFFENPGADLIYGLENGSKKDFAHQRNSGLDHIMCRLAQKNKVAIGISLGEIKNFRRREIVMGRIMQNIHLCRKYKVKMVLASFAQRPEQMRSPHDLRSLGVVLGMHPKEAQQAMSCFE
jgi:hypothetical protein